MIKRSYYKLVFYLCYCIWPRLVNRVRWRITWQATILPGHEDDIIEIEIGNL